MLSLLGQKRDFRIIVTMRAAQHKWTSRLMAVGVSGSRGRDGEDTSACRMEGEADGGLRDETG